MGAVDVWARTAFGRGRRLGAVDREFREFREF